MPWMLYALPLFVCALALPMMLEKLPPNRWYGFRTSKTRSSEAIWYPANRIAGWCLFYAGLLAFALTAMRPHVPFLAELPLRSFILGAHVLPLLLATAYPFWRLRDF